MSTVTTKAGLVVPQEVYQEYEKNYTALRRRAAQEKQEALVKSLDRRREEAAQGFLERQQKILDKRRRTLVYSPYQSYELYAGMDKPKFPSYEQLRNISDRAPLVSAILARRDGQLREYSMLRAVPEDKNAKGWSVTRRESRVSRKKMTAPQRERANELAERLSRPHPTERTLHGFLSKALRDLMVVDRVAVELIPSDLMYRAPGIGKNKISGFCITDGATIKTIPEAALRWVQTAEEYRDSASKMTKEQAMAILDKDVRRYGIDLRGKDYLQFVDGIPFGGFSDSEMILHVSSPRSEMGFFGHGESRLEKAVFGVLAWMQLWGYQVNNFSEALPETLLAIAGAYDEDIMTEVEDQIAELAMGNRGRNRIPIIQVEEKGGIQAVPLRKTPSEMGYGEWETRIIALVASFFDMHPFEINQATIPNGQTTLQESDPNQEVELHSTGFKNMLLECKEIMDRIIDELDPEYEFMWHGVPGLFSASNKEEQELTIEQIKYFSSINEVRRSYGLKEFDKQFFKNCGADDELSAQAMMLMEVPTNTHQHIALLINSNAQARHEKEMEEQAAKEQAAQGGEAGPDAEVEDATESTGDKELDSMLASMEPGGGGEGRPDNKKDASQKPQPETQDIQKSISSLLGLDIDNVVFMRDFE